MSHLTTDTIYLSRRSCRQTAYIRTHYRFKNNCLRTAPVPLLLICVRQCLCSTAAGLDPSQPQHLQAVSRRNDGWSEAVQVTSFVDVDLLTSHAGELQIGVGGSHIFFSDIKPTITTASFVRLDDIKTEEGFANE